MSDRGHAIVEARPQHVAALAEIERAAARLLAGHAPESVLDETTSEEELAEAQAAGRLWVALVDGRPVGFAHVVLLEDGTPHLEEIDVHPRHGRRGLGAALVAEVCRWAQASGHRAVTLTTFRDLPFNMPFYRRLGFREIPPAEIGSELAAIVRDETARGLDPRRRVAMRFCVATPR
jgi:GNAT superfamily N-acetyltransferase